MDWNTSRIIAIPGICVLVIGTILGLMSYNDLGNANFDWWSTHSDDAQQKINEALGAETLSVAVMVLGLGIIAIGIAFKN